MKNNVIGPIAPEDWLTMLMFRQSIGFLKNKGGRDRAIQKEKAILNTFYKKYGIAA